MIQPPWPKMTLRNVLVVEDDYGVRGFLIFALQNGGFTALGVSSGEEAMALLRTTPPAVILIDGILPDMHGIRLARAILDDPAFALLGDQFCDRRNSGRPAGDGRRRCAQQAAPIAGSRGRGRGAAHWRNAGGSPTPDRRAALAELEHIFLVGA